MEILKFENKTDTVEFVGESNGEIKSAIYYVDKNGFVFNGVFNKEEVEIFFDILDTKTIYFKVSI